MKKIMRKKEENIPWTMLMLDLLTAYIITAIMLFVLAFLLFKVSLSKSIIGVMITITYVLTCFVAGRMAGKQMQKRRFMWGAIMGAAYYAVLFLISVIAGQPMSEVANAMFTTLILCVGGGMLGGMLS